MEMFKVKVGGRWVSETKSPNVEFCTGEEYAHIFCNSEINSLRDFLIDIFSDTVIEFIPITTEKQPKSKPKELDLCEILKDAPKGLKLWSVVYGEVEFMGIGKKHTLPVIFHPIDDKFGGGAVKANGTVGKDGECTLFPSKDNRDWSTFKLPYKLPVKGELCWTMSSVCNWIPRFATGEVTIDERPMFFENQSQIEGSYPYQWQPLSEVPEVLKMQLKLK